MTPNVGTIDRILRGALGLVLLYLAFASAMPAFDGTVMKYGAAIIGAVMLITAAVRICPLYTLIGVRTCRI